MLDLPVLLNFLPAEFIIIAVVCGIIAVTVKNIPGIPNWLIPLLNLIVGVVVAVALLGPSPMNVVIGILAASIECYGYELFMSSFGGVKNITDRKEE